jgi:hypothetical protein
MRIPAMSAALLVCFSTTVTAQRFEPVTLKRGAMVRVLASPRQEWQRGTVVSLDTARLVIEMKDLPMKPLLTLPLAGVDSVERGYRLRQADRMGVGLLAGATAGALLLGAIGVATYDTSRGDGENFGFLLGIPGAFLGSVIGVAIGANTGPLEWKPARLPGR